MGANSSQKSKDCTKNRGRVVRNRNKQPPSHKEEINTRNDKVPNNPNMRREEGWNPSKIPCHAMTVGTDDLKVENTEHLVHQKIREACKAPK